jgi:hypothetical protein
VSKARHRSGFNFYDCTSIITFCSGIIIIIIIIIIIMIRCAQSIEIS